MSTNEVIGSRLEQMIDSGVPTDAIAFYGRWWQLETWLRELVYVELRAKFGALWLSHLAPPAPSRADTDEQRNSYMASADEGDLLAYLDSSKLFKLIEKEWDLFEHFLPPQDRWRGLAHQLLDLRNRNAHCRRPHQDDLGRIEQALRDLNKGAKTFYAAYLTDRLVTASRDPIAKAWVDHRHEVASRLIEHAEQQYDTRFRLTYSQRPWCAGVDPCGLSGTQGVLLHANWTVLGGELDPINIWSEISRRRETKDLIVHLLFSSTSVTATFAAIDDSLEVADAIGVIFDEILVDSRSPFSYASGIEGYADRAREVEAKLPARVQVLSPLTTFDPLNPDLFPIFAT